jgi:hypothetical protein
MHHIQFFHMKVFIVCCCIITENVGPTTDAWVSTGPVVEMSQWILQTALDSSQSMGCRSVEANLQQISFLMEAGYRNICFIHPSVQLCISSSYEVWVKRTSKSSRPYMRYIGKVWWLRWILLSHGAVICGCAAVGRTWARFNVKKTEQR